MNKYFFLLISPFLFLSFGCSDDDDIIDDPFSEYPESILGHWGYVSETLTLETTYYPDLSLYLEDDYDGTTIDYPVINESGTGMVYLTFFDNFQMNRSSYSLNSNNQVVDFEESKLVDYSLEGNVISIPNFFPDENSGDGFINQLTETNLEIQWEWNSVEIQEDVSYSDSEGNVLTTDVEISQNIVRVISMYKVSELPQ